MDEGETQLSRIPPKEPGQSLKSIQTRPGYHVELVAAELLVRDPIAIAFDENGRMFVVEFPEYNHRHAGWKLNDQGRVRMLEDTNEDGQFDKSTVYVDGLASPTAVICYDGGVFVAAAPNILFCKDTDGDGRSDVQKAVLTGFAISENRGGGARLNSFRWGLDNRIHACTSFSGGEVRPAGDEQATPISVRNRGIAFDPRSLEFAATSGSGQHGLAIDDWGRFFVCNNSDPFRFLMYESRYLIRNPHVIAPPSYVSIADDEKFTELFRISRVEPWRIERTRRRVAGLYRGSAEGGTPSGYFTSATGVTVYRGDAWPDDYGGDIFVGEVASNLIYRAELAGKGVELIASRADEGAEFVAASDNWFRPVELANAPDGTLYVVDMYRELIETALALPPDVLTQLPPGGGINRGRIFRIVPDGFQQRPPPRLRDASTPQLVKLLEHRNGWHRDTGARLLYERQDRTAIAALKTLAVESKLPEGRMTALYALDGLNALDAETVLPALDDDSDNVRVHAVRLAETLAGRANGVRQKLIAMTDDPSLHVRYQLAFSLGEVRPGDNSQRNAALAQLALRDGGDPWIRFAVFSSLSEGAGQVFAALINDPSFREQAHCDQVLTSLAHQMGAAARKEDIAAVAKILVGLADDDKPLRQSLVQALLERHSRAKRTEILATAGPRAQQILEEQIRESKALSVDEKRDSAERAQAIRVLGMGEFAELQTLFGALLEPRKPLTVQAAVIETLAEFNDAAVAELLLEVWPQLSPQLHAPATETLLSRRVWVDAFLEAVETGRVARGDIAPVWISLLKQHPDGGIRERVNNLDQAAVARPDDVVQSYRPALTLTGDAANGKRLFKRVCSACHVLEGVGNAVGAELSAILARGSSAILLSILDPNREVKPIFLSYVLQTNDGRVLTGMISAENANNVILRRPDGTTVSVQRTQIEHLRSTGLSFMPEGLQKQLDHQAMADLLEYLNSAK